MNKKETGLNVFLLLALILLLPPGGFSAWTWTAGVRWLYLFFMSALLAAILVPFSVFLAKKMGAIDYPDERKVHTKPVPRLGGVAVYLAFVFTIIRNFQFSEKSLGIIIGSTIIFFLGLADDVKNLSARTRLFWQLAASIVVIYFGLYLSFPLKLPFGHFISYTLSVLWLIGITNAFNFMDGIDGMASTMSIICSLLFLGIAWNSEQYVIGFFSAAVAGSCLGFLKFNWNPAKVFLGDSGSTFIGFVLACLALSGSWATNNPWVALSTPLLILGIPIFDLVYTTISRIKNGKIHNVIEWLEYTARDHFHHRLMKIGCSVKSSVGFTALLNVCLGLGAWSMQQTGSTVATFFLLFQSVLIFIVVIVLMLLGRQITN